MAVSRKAVVWGLVAVVAAVLFVAGTLMGDDRPGDPEVYDRIGSLTDCEAVQAEFDTASANNARETPGSDLAEATLGYMEAAADRLDELGCYG